MAPRQPATAKVCVPGPGSHNVPSHWNGELRSSRVATSTAFSMTKDEDKRTQRGDKAAPGHYEPNHDAYLKSTVKYAFSGEKRHLTEKSKASATPGPANEPGDNQNFHRPPQFSFGNTARVLQIPGGLASYSNAQKTNQKQPFPGPGQHDAKHEASSKVVCGPSFSTPAKRDPFANSKTHNPGPGAYEKVPEGKELNTPRYGFGTAARMLLPTSPAEKAGGGAATAKKAPPGPGEYAVEKTHKGAIPVGEGAPKWSMTGRAGFDLSRGYC